MFDTGVHSKVKEPERTGQIQFDKLMGVRSSMLWVSRLCLSQSVHKIESLFGKDILETEITSWSLENSIIFFMKDLHSICSVSEMSNISDS